MVATPLTVFSRSPQNAKESDLGHIGNLFNILCGHFDEKKIEGTTLPGGRVTRPEDEWGGCNLFQKIAWLDEG